MSKIQKFTTTNATITINDATTLHFNHNKCYKIDAPYIFTTAYKCGEYILLHELQGFQTDKVIEPKTSEEFRQGLHSQDNPFYLDVYDSLFDSLSIKEGALHGYDLYERLVSYKNESLEYFHLFKVDEGSWSEVELDLSIVVMKNFIEWSYLANGIIQKDREPIKRLL